MRWATPYLIILSRKRKTFLLDLTVKTGWVEIRESEVGIERTKKKVAVPSALHPSQSATRRCTPRIQASVLVTEAPGDTPRTDLTRVEVGTKERLSHSIG